LEIVDYTPKYLKGMKLPWAETRIMPIGDIQYGSDGVDVARLRKHINWGVEHDCLFIGTGDYSDFLSPSNRRALRNAGLYDTSANSIAKWARAQEKELFDILKPTKGRWLGLLEGHHFYEHEDGATTDTHLCEMLEAPFLGTCAMVRLTFEGNKRSKDCLIWAHHGQGGGDDPLRRLMRVAPAFPQVDIFLQGHNTSIDARPKDVLEVYGPPGHIQLRDRTQMFVACGGFFRGYQRGSKAGPFVGRARGSYVEKDMMRPTAIGGPLITVTPRAKHDYNELDIKCSV